ALFFFSSRRRHTSFSRDWSSDVCSSDLTPETLRGSAGELQRAHAAADPSFLELMREAIANIREYQSHIRHASPPPLRRGGRVLRSEERRVGKERRAAWAARQSRGTRGEG